MRASIVSCSLVALTTLWACGNPSHEELLESFEAPSGEYRLLYLSPPWNLVETDADYLRLEIEANGVRFGDLDAGVVPPKFLCEASVAPGTAASAIRDAERRARRDGDDVVWPATELATSSGATGFDLVTSRLTSDGSRFSRVVFLDRASGVVRVYFEANDDLRDAEVDAMISDVTVDPE